MEQKRWYSLPLQVLLARPLVLLLAAFALALTLVFMIQSAIRPAQAAEGAAISELDSAPLVWTSAHWANGSARTLRPGQRDSADPTGWSEATGPSGIRVQIDGDGVMALSGDHPRLYIQSEKHGSREFTNVEATTYYRRVDDDNTPWAGLTIAARSGSDAHGHPGGDDCDAHTYYMRFMHNGSVDFDKELAHNEHAARAEKKGVFGNSLPFNQWIGGKFRIYNLPNGHVKLEAYADFGDGVWKLVNETVDDGTWAADSGGCSQWDSDRDIYTGAGVVFIRNTDVDRAEYRDFSVRELGAVDKEPTPSEPVGIPLRINAGGGQVEDGNGDIWRADQAYGPGNAWGYAASSGGAANHNLNVSGTDEDAIYSTERWGMDAYRVDVENGEYDVRLLFAETYDGITGATQRVFDVTVEGNEVSPALDAYAEAGFGTALVKDVQGVVVNDGRLDIVFDGQVENPMIKGVAVLPEGTLSGATPTPTPPPTTTPTPTPPEPEPEPLVGAPFRINTGGSEVQDESGDVWQADQSYGEGNIWGYVPSGQGGAADHDLNVAGADEDEIFSTERWGMDAYRLDVEDGEYDVRLLFAETYGGITGAGQRVFDVTVEGAPVAAALDVYATAGFASAMVREARNVQVADGRLDIEFGSRVENPMIKGIELLPAGSLGEPEPDPDPAVHAADMDGTSIVDSSGTWEAFARVTVANELSQPVLGAVVTVEWEANGSTRNAMCTTGFGGSCTVGSGAIPSEYDTASAEVTDVAVNGLPFDSTSGVTVLSVSK